MSIQIIFHSWHFCILPARRSIPTGSGLHNSSEMGQEQHRLARSWQQLPHTNKPSRTTSASGAIAWSLQVVWKLKRFRGCCTNYSRLASYSSSRGGCSRAGKWILNTLAFLHIHRAVLNYVPRKYFNNSFLPSLLHAAWEPVRWISTLTPGFWVILVDRMWWCNYTQLQWILRGGGPNPHKNEL